MRNLIIIVALLSLTGCTGIKLSLPQPNSATQAGLARLFNSPIEPSRGFRPTERMAVVDKVDRIIQDGCGKRVPAHIQ